ncbi:hypothetical protein DVH24_036868 [Malus domestica]|uniref:Uncharacterized protein n=1 Tax=Malus domestica TaxID=3750 RepID=A0A498IKF5_MALDO|nr:hypothetical protein DVH24_036868 [Malus domestica]
MHMLGATDFSSNTSLKMTFWFHDAWSLSPPDHLVLCDCDYACLTIHDLGDFLDFSNDFPYHACPYLHFSDLLDIHGVPQDYVLVFRNPQNKYSSQLQKE